ncbi:MAG: FxDxF family PEP-CTERM protein [Rhizobacter sp.]|nr:FxDxF family PEP-CTERM protein [Rhizobacter sp.]
MDLGIRNGACVSGGDNCHGPVQASATIGSTSQTFTEASAVAGNVWGTFGFNFVATGPSMTLTIDGVSLPAGNEFIGLDNVSVTPAVAAVPEPETYALLLAGLALVGTFGRRARR